MRNEDFKRLVALLEGDPGLLHDFLMKGAGKPEVSALLSEFARAFAATTPGRSRLANALLSDAVERAGRMDAIAACVDSCEGSRLGAGIEGLLEPGAGAGLSPECPMTGCSCTNASTCTTTCEAGTCAATCPATAAFEDPAGRATGLAGGGCGANDVTCACTSGTCGGGSCQVTVAVEELPGGPGDAPLAAGRLAAGCDANTTCSCTSSTCGGVTCGGSTCGVTCSGDSCGNTCGDSCGHTTNLTRDLESRVRRLRQADFWR